MQKRFLAMLLAIVMLVSLLAACGEQASVTDSTPSLQTPAVSSPVDSISFPKSSSSSEPIEIIESSPSTVPEQTVDASSTLLPDLEAFLYCSASTAKKYGDYGYQLQWNGSHPGAAFETVKQELLNLLAEKRYQLKLVESTLNPHYIGIEMHEFFYIYTGTSDKIKMLIDEYDEHEFNVRLRITYYPEYNYFKLSLVYSIAFDPEDPGTRTTRNIDPNSDGGILETPPVSSDDDDDFWEKCSACHGSGKCTHCNGKGEVRKFQAGLGWVEQDCTLCNRGKCRYCNGTGKD